MPKNQRELCILKVTKGLHLLIPISCHVVHISYPNYLLWLTSQDNHVEIDSITCSIHVFFLDDFCDVLPAQLDSQWASAAYLEE